MNAFAPGLIGGWICWFGPHGLQVVTEDPEPAAELGFHGDQVRSSDILLLLGVEPVGLGWGGLGWSGVGWGWMSPVVSRGGVWATSCSDHLGKLQGSDFPSCPARPWNLLEELFLLELLPQQPGQEEEHLSKSQTLNTRIISVVLSLTAAEPKG